MNKTGVIRPYNITDVGENDAEINMYGEVVDTRPIDFWTGEPVAGNFIMLDEFLRDLDNLKAKDNITVHINSVGGDLYAGVSIYNRLKSMPANITTINDGLAASAGSVIFMAGNTRKMNAGSNLMIHQAAGLLIGYYNNNDLKDVMKQLTAANKVAVNIYAEATGMDADTIKTQVDRETWFTGQEAVDAGYAHEILEGVPVSMSLTADRSHMIVNGVSLSTRGMSNIPQSIPVMPMQNKVSPAAPAPGEDKENLNDGGKKMENIKTIDELKAAFPDLVAQVESAAQAAGNSAGIEAERARIQGIEAIENAIADKSLINSAKFGDTPLTAEQLALKAMQAQAAIGATVLTNMQKDAEKSGAASVQATPNSGAEPGGKQEENPKAMVEEAIKNFKMMKNGGVK